MPNSARAFVMSRPSTVRSILRETTNIDFCVVLEACVWFARLTVSRLAQKSAPEGCTGINTRSAASIAERETCIVSGGAVYNNVVKTIIRDQPWNRPVQRRLRQPDDPERLLAIANGGPVLRGLLGVGVDQKDTLALCRQGRGQVDGNRRLSGAALLVDHSDDHDRVLTVSTRTRVLTGTGGRFAPMGRSGGASSSAAAAGVDVTFGLRFSVHRRSAVPIPLCRAT